MSTAALNEMFKQIYGDALDDLRLSWKEYCEKKRAQSDARSMDLIIEDAILEDAPMISGHEEDECPCCGVRL